MIEFSLTFICMVVAICIGAGFVQRVSGFGLGIFVMLFLPYIMPSHAQAAAVSCIFSCGISTYNAIKYRKNIKFKTVLPLLCAALVTIPIAVAFSGYAPKAVLTRLLGIILIGLSIYFLFFNNRVNIKPTVKNGVLTGALSGLLNGLFSTGGPPVVLYLTHATGDNISYFAAIQFYFALTNIYSTAVRVVGGIITWKLFLCSLIGMAGCAVGDMLGTYVFEKLNAERLRFLIYIGMIISGILMLV